MIVVIGILAAVTIATYVGLNQRAIGASLQSDLKDASTQLKLYRVDNGSYPTSNDCTSGHKPTPPKICLKSSNDTTYEYTTDGSPTPHNFTLKATRGNISYIVTDDSSPTLLTAISVIGGTITTSGIYTIHTFLSSGTLVVTGGTITGAEVLVIGGGGGGGGGNGPGGGGGGGGAGQFLTASNINLSGSTVVTVGNGGLISANGSNSIFGTYVAIGGGAGGNYEQQAGFSGASGGGSGGNALPGGLGTSGYNGGGSVSGSCTSGQPGGGGGAGGIGGNGLGCIGGSGGVGLSSSISGSVQWYAGGGAAENGGYGSSSGGGSFGSNGVANTGGGGAGGALGGSGIVIVRYQTP